MNKQHEAFVNAILHKADYLLDGLGELTAGINLIFESLEASLNRAIERQDIETATYLRAQLIRLRAKKDQCIEKLMGNT